MFDLINLRNSDFMERCRELLHKADGSRLSARSVAVAAAAMPPKAYYLTYDYALRRIRKHRSEGASAAGDRRWQELSDRVALRQQLGGISLPKALQRELTDGHPSRFFISDSYAERLLQRLLNVSAKQS